MSSSEDADPDSPERSAGADDMLYVLGGSPFVGEMNP